MVEAEYILNICNRFHCLPSALDDEDAELMKYLAIARLGEPDGE